MSKIKRRNINTIVFIILIIKFIFCQIDECQREKPIKVGEECLSKNCSELQFKSGEWIISNSIIKTQWLNNIISVGEKDYRFLNIITSSQGDLIVSTSSYPAKRERIYFGINSNGLPIFKDNNNNDIYIIKKNILSTSSNNYKRYEAVPGFIKINGDTNINKEYLIELGKSTTYTEIFDYIDYNQNLIEMENEKTINATTETYVGCLENYIEDGINYYFFAGIQKYSDTDFRLLLIKFKFYYDGNGNVLCNNNKRITINSLDKRIVNCYLINNNILICLYVARNNNYKILFLNTNLDIQDEIDLSIASPTSLITFFKFLHLKDDIWPFLYYQGGNEDNPIIQFLEIKLSESSYSIVLKNAINLNKYYFNNTRLLTDFIKIRNNLLCVTATQKSKEVLIIILINFFNEMEYNIRYYLIDIFSLYNFKILKELKSIVYNNNLAIAFSFCQQKICDEDSSEHYSSLIFFSYPNTNDYQFDMIDYLNKEENNDLIINLFDNINIDNNIFGFIIDKIKIYTIDSCAIDFISNRTKVPIQNDDFLEENEVLELVLKNEEYEITNCKITYSLIITESDYDEYNKYPNFILKENDENERTIFSKNTYEGKIGYFNVFIKQDITKDCGEENIYCKLCSKTDKSNCFLCKNEYDFIDNKKICKNDVPTTINDLVETTINDLVETTINDLVDTTIINLVETTIIENPIISTVIENDDGTTIVRNNIQSSVIESGEETTLFESSETYNNVKNYTKILNEYNLEDLKKGKGSNLTLTNEEFKEMYSYIKNDLLNENYNNENVIIQTSDVVFQLSKLEDQENTDLFISSVELKQCENKLKSNYHIKDEDSLIIFKIDVRSQDSLTTYVKYEIYDQYNFTQ